MAKAPFKIKPLANENRAAFQCAESALNSYLIERAPRDIKQNLAAVFVLVSKDDPLKILGYYTLSTLSIITEELPEQLREKTGRYHELGATLIGRLAADSSCEGQGHGALLLAHALRECVRTSATVASFAVIVDAKNESAARFYIKHGFQQLSGKRYFLPMGTAQQLYPRAVEAPDESDP
jgi:GNAT superfamily N-acetyltransferase